MQADGVAPAPRAGHSAVYDEVHNRMIVFGGAVPYSSTCYSDTFVLTDANGTGETPVWMTLSPTGPAPTPRYLHGGVYNPNKNKLIVFGGDACGEVLNDVWVLANANDLSGNPSWTQLTPSGNLPNAREPGATAYNPTTNRMIVFGGSDGFGTFFNDLWVLSNADGTGGVPTWTALAAEGPLPSPRGYFASSYDQITNTITVFGGQSADALLQDTWVLSNADGSSGTPTWVELGASTLTPEPRAGHTAIYSPHVNTMAIFGGFLSLNGPNYIVTNEIWTLRDGNGQ